MQDVEKSTGKAPQALQNKPDYPSEHGEYLEAFDLLSRGRRQGFGVGFIPLSEIEVYCRMFDVVDVELFVRVIVELDSVFMQHIERLRKERERKHG